MDSVPTGQDSRRRWRRVIIWDTDGNWQKLLQSQYAREKSVMVVPEKSEEKRVHGILECTTKHVCDHSETGLLGTVEEERPAVPENFNRDDQSGI